MNKLFNDLESKAIIQEGHKGECLKKYIDKCRRMNNDYNSVINEKQKNETNDANILRKMNKNLIKSRSNI